MKKLIFSCLISIILGIWQYPIWASQEYDFNVKVIINDTIPDFSDQPPFICNNRVYVPLRIFADLLEADLAWNKAYQQTVFIRFKEGDVLGMKIGETEYTWKGKFQVLDVPPILINNRVMIPLRIIAETRNAEVKWKGEIRTVYVKWEDPTWSKILAALVLIFPGIRDIKPPYLAKQLILPVLQEAM